MNKLTKEQVDFIISKVKKELPERDFEWKWDEDEIEQALSTAIEAVGAEEEIDKRVIHINTTPEFLANPDNVKMINKMVGLAGEITQTCNIHEIEYGQTTCKHCGETYYHSDLVCHHDWQTGWHSRFCRICKKTEVLTK